MSTYGAEASIKHLQLRSASIEAPRWYTELCNLHRYDELQIYTYGAVARSPRFVTCPEGSSDLAEVYATVRPVFARGAMTSRHELIH